MCKFHFYINLGKLGRLPTAGRQRAVFRTLSGTRLFYRPPLQVGVPPTQPPGGRLPTFATNLHISCALCDLLVFATIPVESRE